MGVMLPLMRSRFRGVDGGKLDDHKGKR